VDSSNKKTNFVPIHHRICNINFASTECVERPDIKRLKETAVASLFISQERFDINSVQIQHSYCGFSELSVKYYLYFSNRATRLHNE
jgi:hypothetical protein